MAARLRPTHFLSIPLGQQHADLRAKVNELRDALDPSLHPILVAPARIHFTLGVMCLDTRQPGSKTIEEALFLLRDLPSRLPQLKETAPVIPTGSLDVLKREGIRGAHVLHVGPKRWSQNEPLFELLDRIHAIFREEGFITETRPLKLHMTVLNTNFSRNRKRAKPFSFDVIRAGAAALGVKGDLAEDFNLPLPMWWGSYEAPSLHLCTMGSYAPDGGYVSLGSTPLKRLH